MKPTSHAIGKSLEDETEVLLQRGSLVYRRGHPVVSRFGSAFKLDFYLPKTENRPAVVIECKNFGVAARRKDDSQRRKAQEALYLLMHVRRHCEVMREVRIILVTGAEPFSVEQTQFLQAELGPDFHIVSIMQTEDLHSLIAV